MILITFYFKMKFSKNTSTNTTFCQTPVLLSREVKIINMNMEHNESSIYSGVE